ncbi:MAG: hypothetical protein P4L74_02680 [Candidatus Doudnabacteria bacterium]|nr:hypothetical protein [Candidatus Doudnabacteria bacterium]
MGQVGKYQKSFNISRDIASGSPLKKEMLSRADLETLKKASEVALAVIAVAGVVAISAVAPNLLIALDSLFRRRGYKYSKAEKERKAARTFYYLKKTGLIDIREDGSKLKVFLTKLGKRKAEKLNLNFCQIPKPHGWDGKWWLVAADIPTKLYRRQADMLRRKIKELGFYPLQRTLWLYPFNPIKEIGFITEYFGIGQFVTVMEISRLDLQDEETVKEHYKKLGIL